MLSINSSEEYNKPTRLQYICGIGQGPYWRRTLQNLVVISHTTSFGVQKYYAVNTLFVYAFCVNLKSNISCFPVHHQVTGFLQPIWRMFTARSDLNL